MSVGRLAEEKNLEELLHLRAAMGEAPVTLLLVGGGPDKLRLEGIAAGLGLTAPAVVFAGMVPPAQVPDWYQLGDLFVRASTSETQGLTYIEALAAGVPALCRADPCLAGVIREGENGWQYRDREEFQQKLTEIRRQPGAVGGNVCCGPALYADIFYTRVCGTHGEHLPQSDGPPRRRQAGGVRMTKERMTLQVLSLAGLVACVILALWGWRTGVLTSQEQMQALVHSCGAVGVVLFILFQAVQVVVPVLPGGIGCLAGVLIFGPVWGFVYNYVGICIGSLAAFAVARNCGKPLLTMLFSEKTIAKYSRWAEERNRFARLFALAIFLPVAPDDFLCYLAGTTEMSWRQYTAIILLGKPFAIALYSLGLTVVWQHLVTLLQ